MKIGIITLSRITVTDQLYYNAQDYGLAKALHRAGHEVTVYRLACNADKRENINGIKIIYQKTRGVGKQSITTFSFLDRQLEQLICFSDNQVIFSRLFRYCKKNAILLQPYIGVLQSNSSNRIVKAIMDMLVRVNVAQYRKLMVYAKTPMMQQQLMQVKIENTKLAPVALDLELLHQDSKDADRNEIRKQYGYEDSDKVLLFIGRMESEKEPLLMLHMMKELYQRDDGYRLIMIGKGALLEIVQEKAKTLGIDAVIRFEESVVYSSIWQYYLMADCYINLNRHEIYGMAILEALYYECPIAAMEAPGPLFILKEIAADSICSQTTDMIDCIVRNIDRKGKKDVNTRNYIEQRFCWDSVAAIFTNAAVSKE